MIKRLREVAELTVPQQRVVIIALCGLVGVVALKSYRSAALHAHSVPPAVVDQPSPSPGIRP